MFADNGFDRACPSGNTIAGDYDGTGHYQGGDDMGADFQTFLHDEFERENVLCHETFEDWFICLPTERVIELANQYAEFYRNS